MGETQRRPLGGAGVYVGSRVAAQLFDSLLPDRAAFLDMDCLGALPERLQPFAVTATFRSAAVVAIPPVVMAAVRGTE